MLRRYTWAAVLLTAMSCGGDDEMNLSPISPSTITMPADQVGGNVAQQAGGVSTDLRTDGQVFALGETNSSGAVDFSVVTWSWNGAETHLEPSSIPDSRVGSGSNIWRRGNGTGLIRISSSTDLSGVSFSTAGSSWTLSMRREGLYVAGLSSSEVEAIASYSAPTRNAPPPPPPPTPPPVVIIVEPAVDFSNVDWTWNAAETHLEPSSIPDSRVESGSNIWRRGDGTGLVRLLSSTDLAGLDFTTEGMTWTLSQRRSGLYVPRVRCLDQPLQHLQRHRLQPVPQQELLTPRELLHRRNQPQHETIHRLHRRTHPARVGPAPARGRHHRDRWGATPTRPPKMQRAEESKS